MSHYNFRIIIFFLSSLYYSRELHVHIFLISFVYIYIAVTGPIVKTGELRYPLPGYPRHCIVSVFLQRFIFTVYLWPYHSTIVWLSLAQWAFHRHKLGGCIHCTCSNKASVNPFKLFLEKSNCVDTESLIMCISPVYNRSQMIIQILK